MDALARVITPRLRSYYDLRHTPQICPPLAMLRKTIADARISRQEHGMFALECAYRELLLSCESADEFALYMIFYGRYLVQILVWFVHRANGADIDPPEQILALPRVVVAHEPEDWYADWEIHFEKMSDLLPDNGRFDEFLLKCGWALSTIDHGCAYRLVD